MLRKLDPDDGFVSPPTGGSSTGNKDQTVKGDRLPPLLDEYQDSLYSTRKQQLIKQLALSLVDALHIKKSDISRMHIHEFVKKVKSYMSDSKTPPDCQLLAKSLNEIFPTLHLDVSLPANKLCPQVKEHLSSLFNGLHTELSSTLADVKIIGSNLSYLTSLLDAPIIVDGTDIASQLKHQVELLKSKISNVITRKDSKSPIIKLSDQSDDWSFVLTDMADVIIITRAIDKALRKIGISISKYKKCKTMRDLVDLISKANKVVTTSDEKRRLNLAINILMNTYSANEDVTKYITERKDNIRVSKDVLLDRSDPDKIGGFNPTELISAIKRLPKNIKLDTTVTTILTRDIPNFNTSKSELLTDTKHLIRILEELTTKTELDSAYLRELGKLQAFVKSVENHSGGEVMLRDVYLSLRETIQDKLQSVTKSDINETNVELLVQQGLDNESSYVKKLATSASELRKAIITHYDKLFQEMNIIAPEKGTVGFDIKIKVDTHMITEDQAKYVAGMYLNMFNFQREAQLGMVELAEACEQFYHTKLYSKSQPSRDQLVTAGQLINKWQEGSDSSSQIGNDMAEVCELWANTTFVPDPKQHYYSWVQDVVMDNNHVGNPIKPTEFDMEKYKKLFSLLQKTISVPILKEIITGAVKTHPAPKFTVNYLYDKLINYAIAMSIVHERPLVGGGGGDTFVQKYVDPTKKYMAAISTIVDPKVHRRLVIGTLIMIALLTTANVVYDANSKRLRTAKQYAMWAGEALIAYLGLLSVGSTLYRNLENSYPSIFGKRVLTAQEMIDELNKLQKKVDVLKNRIQPEKTDPTSVVESSSSSSSTSSSSSSSSSSSVASSISSSASSSTEPKSGGGGEWVDTSYEQVKVKVDDVAHHGSPSQSFAKIAQAAVVWNADSFKPTKPMVQHGEKAIDKQKQGVKQVYGINENVTETSGGAGWLKVPEIITSLTKVMGGEGSNPLQMISAITSIIDPEHQNLPDIQPGGTEAESLLKILTVASDVISKGSGTKFVPASVTKFFKLQFDTPQFLSDAGLVTGNKMSISDALNAIQSLIGSDEDKAKDISAQILDMVLEKLQKTVFKDSAIMKNIMGVANMASMVMGGGSGTFQIRLRDPTKMDQFGITNNLFVDIIKSFCGYMLSSIGLSSINQTPQPPIAGGSVVDRRLVDAYIRLPQIISWYKSVLHKDPKYLPIDEQIPNIKTAMSSLIQPLWIETSDKNLMDIIAGINRFGKKKTSAKLISDVLDDLAKRVKTIVSSLVEDPIKEEELAELINADVETVRKMTKVPKLADKLEALAPTKQVKIIMDHMRNPEDVAVVVQDEDKILLPILILSRISASLEQFDDFVYSTDMTNIKDVLEDYLESHNELPQEPIGVFEPIFGNKTSRRECFGKYFNNGSVTMEIGVHNATETRTCETVSGLWTAGTFAKDKSRFVDVVMRWMFDRKSILRDLINHLFICGRQLIKAGFDKNQPFYDPTGLASACFDLTDKLDSQVRSESTAIQEKYASIKEHLVAYLDSSHVKEINEILSSTWSHLIKYWGFDADRNMLNQNESVDSYDDVLSEMLYWNYKMSPDVQIDLGSLNAFPYHYVPKFKSGSFKPFTTQEVAADFIATKHEPGVPLSLLEQDRQATIMAFERVSRLIGGEDALFNTLARATSFSDRGTVDADSLWKLPFLPIVLVILEIWIHILKSDMKWRFVSDSYAHDAKQPPKDARQIPAPASLTKELDPGNVRVPEVTDEHMNKYLEAVMKNHPIATMKNLDMFGMEFSATTWLVMNGIVWYAGVKYSNDPVSIAKAFTSVSNLVRRVSHWRLPFQFATNEYFVKAQTMARQMDNKLTLLESSRDIKVQADATKVVKETLISLIDIREKLYTEVIDQDFISKVRDIETKMSRKQHVEKINTANLFLVNRARFYDGKTYGTASGMIPFINQLLACYINGLAETTPTKRIYVNLLDELQTGSIAKEIVKGESIQDINFQDKYLKDIKDRVALLSDPPDGCALFASLAVTIKSILFAQGEKENTLRFGLSQTDDKPLYMKELFKANLPLISKELDYQLSKLDLIESVLKTKIDVTRTIPTDFMEDKVFVELKGVEGVHKGMRVVHKETSRERKSFFHDMISELRTLIINWRRSVTKVYDEMNDVALYYETHENSIRDYKARYNVIPKHTLSLMSMFLNPTTSYKPNFIIGSPENKVLYGVRLALSNTLGSTRDKPLIPKIEMFPYLESKKEPLFDQIMLLLRHQVDTEQIRASGTNITNNTIESIAPTHFYASYDELIQSIEEQPTEDETKGGTTLIELGISPQDHSGFSRLPFEHVGMYAQAFDNNVRTSLDVNSAGSERHFMHKLLTNPYGERSPKEFFSILPKILHGEDTLRIGVPRFLAEEMWNKVLLNNSYEFSGDIYNESAQTRTHKNANDNEPYIEDEYLKFIRGTQLVGLHVNDKRKELSLIGYDRYNTSFIRTIEWIYNIGRYVKFYINELLQYTPKKK